MKICDLEILDKLNESIQLKKMFTISQIAKKHNVDESEVGKALKQGIKVEYEHTDNELTAKTIASHHLIEDLNYYSKLKKIEKK
jgi:hypothetical protein